MYLLIFLSCDLFYCMMYPLRVLKIESLDQRMDTRTSEPMALSSGMTWHHLTSNKIT